MPCPSVVATVAGIGAAQLEIDDCAKAVPVFLLDEEILLVVAALEASAARAVSTVVQTETAHLKIERVENPPAKAVVSVAAKDGPWTEVSVGTARALEIASDLRAAIGP